MKLQDLLKGFWQSKTPRSSRKRLRVRPSLEALEDRTVPADVVWTNGVGSYVWGVTGTSGPGNWSTPQIPAATDTSDFNSTGSNASSVADNNYSVSVLSDDGSYGGNLFIPIGTSVSASDHVLHQNVLELTGGQAISTQGTYYLTGGAIVPSAGGPLEIDTGGFDDGGLIHVPAGAVLRIVDTGAFTQLSSCPIIVDPGGALVIDASAISLTGTVSNGGSLTLAASSLINIQAGSNVTSSGTLTLTAPLLHVEGQLAGAGATASQPPNIPAPGLPVALSGLSYIVEMGTVTTEPGLDIRTAVGEALTGPGATGLSAPLVGAGGTGGTSAVLSISGAVLAETGSTLTMGDATTLTVNGDVTLHGSLSMTDAIASVSGNFLMQGGTLSLNFDSGGSTLTVTGSMDVDASSTVTLSSSTLTAGTALTDEGSITMTDATIGGLTVKPAGTLVMQSADSQVNNVMGNLSNDGGTISIIDSQIRVAGNVLNDGTASSPGIIKFDASLYWSQQQRALQIDGSFTQTANGELFVAAGFDASQGSGWLTRIHVQDYAADSNTSAVSLAGKLFVTFLGDPFPADYTLPMITTHPGFIGGNFSALPADVTTSVDNSPQEGPSGSVYYFGSYLLQFSGD
jgi:hypothetical protein